MPHCNRHWSWYCDRESHFIGWIIYLLVSGSNQQPLCIKWCPTAQCREEIWTVKILIDGSPFLKSPPNLLFPFPMKPRRLRHMFVCLTLGSAGTRLRDIFPGYKRKRRDWMPVLRQAARQKLDHWRLCYARCVQPCIGLLSDISQRFVSTFLML